MANWCNNSAVFKGTPEQIKRFIDILTSAVAEQHTTCEGVSIHDSEQIDDYFFDIEFEADTDSVSMNWITKYNPNIEDVAIICKNFGLSAEHEYSENGFDVYGTAKYNSDGTYTDNVIEQEFLNCITYDEDSDMYTFNCVINGVDIVSDDRCKDELLDRYYSRWKEAQV